MEQQSKFVDMLAERRKDCDILWASRAMDPLLPHKLPPEAKYSRKQTIEAVLKDLRVQLAIETLSTARQIDKAVVEKDARMMVNEMASKAHLPTVRWLGILITKVLKRIFLSIYINENALFKLKKEMQISQVQYVYAPSHRSYLDFVLLSYILFSYDMALPNIASGMDFYQMHIVGELLRKTGAFYMRRSFSNDLLYKRVFRAYVMSLVSHSDRAIEFFIEGTRSRSLKSITPKYGLLSIILESLLEGKVPDIHFIPITINYERPPEELLFAYELLGIPKPKESTAGLFRSLSILQKPYAYGRVFFNVAEPISAQQFLTLADRKAGIFSPHAKLPSTAVENLAYFIIDSHKRNTILVPFNLIALLFNERIQMHPGEAYTLNQLQEDYRWCKNIFYTLFNAKIQTTGQNFAINNDAREEILSSMKPHEELLVVDSSNVVRLVQRHKETKLQKAVRVKGHVLSTQTMQVAVSAINLVIYINPTLSFIIKPAIITIAVGASEIELGAAFKRYVLIRKLLSTEFTMSPKVNESQIKSEWEEAVNLLVREDCLALKNGTHLVSGQNTKLFSLLYNVVLPFIDAIHITCLVLFEWDESTLNEPTIQSILVESQKRAETGFLEKTDSGQHPYCLSLDLFSSSLSNLVAQGIVVSYGKKGAYRANKISLAHLLAQFKELSLKRPQGSYLDLSLLSESALRTLHAKL